MNEPISITECPRCAESRRLHREYLKLECAAKGIILVPGGERNPIANCPDCKGTGEVPPRVDRTELWCVHVLGPDTVIPQPDFWTAAERAAKWSQGMLEMHRRDPHPYDPCMYCNVVPWPYAPEGHAAALAEHGGEPADIC